MRQDVSAALTGNEALACLCSLASANIPFTGENLMCANVTFTWEIVCANDYVYLGKFCAQMNHILSKMCANVLPPYVHVYMIMYFSKTLHNCCKVLFHF